MLIISICQGRHIYPISTINEAPSILSLLHFLPLSNSPVFAWHLISMITVLLPKHRSPILINRALIFLKFDTLIPVTLSVVFMTLQNCHNRN